MALVIRPVRSIDEARACEAVQRQAWVMPDDLEVVPVHLLVSVQHNGGLLLGAFDGDELVGCVFGFPGLAADGQLKHCSHMLGVVPAYRDQGVGYRLKLAQREAALAQGCRLITWNYDPLQSRNAYLNVHKLGGICRTYLRDFYGLLTDGLNAGLPSDRFELEWWIADERVERRLAGGPGDRPPDRWLEANVTGRTAAGWPTPETLRLETGAPAVRVEIPADFGVIQAADPDLAGAWRQATREIMEFYFAAGYAVVEFESQAVAEGRRSFYRLQAG